MRTSIFLLGKGVYLKWFLSSCNKIESPT